MLYYPLIIGVYGKKQSGKTTLFHHLKRLGGSINVDGPINVWSAPFAEPLKRIIIELLIPSDWDIRSATQLDDDEIKNMMLPCGVTVRKALQVVGTDWFRFLDPDIWVNRWVRDHVTGPSMRPIIRVVPDVRFPNEARVITDLGGLLVKLTRDPIRTDDPTRNHASETALDQWPDAKFDIVLDNRDMSICEQEEATRTLFTPILQEYFYVSP